MREFSIIELKSLVFGRTCVLQYDSTGMLTNVTDVAGLSSSFKYDYQGWATNLITPYGTTIFEHATNADNLSDEFHPVNYYQLTRSIRITDPAGGTNVYVLREDSSYNWNPADMTYDSPFLSTDWDPAVVPDSSVPTPTLDPSYRQWRDSFHWGPRQASGLPADLNTISTPQYQKAGMRHWLHNGYFNSQPPDFISQSLDVQRDPSPDGVNDGQTTWFDYAMNGAGQPASSKPTPPASAPPRSREPISTFTPLIGWTSFR